MPLSNRQLAQLLSEGDLLLGIAYCDGIVLRGVPRALQTNKLHNNKSSKPASQPRIVSLRQNLFGVGHTPCHQLTQHKNTCKSV
jgi:hypothetical protein